MKKNNYDLNDLQYQANNLLHLLQAAHSQIMEMDFGTGAGRNHQLDRVSALVSVARDYTETVCENIDTHFHAIESGGGCGKEAAEQHA